MHLSFFEVITQNAVDFFPDMANVCDGHKDIVLYQTDCISKPEQTQ